MDDRESQAKIDGLLIVHKWSGGGASSSLELHLKASGARLTASVVIVHIWIG